MAWLGNSFLLVVTSLSMLAVLFIFIFIARDAWPFFKLEGFREFFTSTRWYPSAEKPEFGALAIFVGSAYVTFGAILVAVPLGIAAAICLSDVIPFALRQFIKPVIEMLAAIPSVAYGFFALVVFAPLLQQQGGHLLATAVWIIGLPIAILGTVVISDVLSDRFGAAGPEALALPLGINSSQGRAAASPPRRLNLRLLIRYSLVLFLGSGAIAGLFLIGKALAALHIASEIGRAHV